MTPQAQTTGFAPFLVFSILKGYNPNNLITKCNILKTLKTVFGLMQNLGFSKFMLLNSQLKFYIFSTHNNNLIATEVFFFIIILCFICVNYPAFIIYDCKGQTILFKLEKSLKITKALITYMYSKLYYMYSPSVDWRVASGESPFR